MKKAINFSWKTEIWPIAILLAVIALSLWSYPQLPAKVISHWGLDGQANGWSSREFHAIFFPALLVAMYGLFSLMPNIDPRREQYAQFSGVYLIMRNSILLVLAAVFAAATFANLGYKVNIAATVAGIIGLLMVVLGNYFGKLKRNYFVGIRTPWALSSDNVWNKTHRLGGRLFMAWGVCLMIAPWLSPLAAFSFLFGGLLIVIAWVSIYSYLAFKKEKKG